MLLLLGKTTNNDFLIVTKLEVTYVMYYLKTTNVKVH
jgi:hypothetical protein